MQAGRIEQIGTPEAVYRAPATAFVAEFMGTTNLFNGTVTGRDGDLLRVRTGAHEFLVRAADEPSSGAVTFSLRPEMLRLLGDETPPPGWAALTATLVRIEFLGILTRLELRLDDRTTLRAASLDLLPEGLTVNCPVTVAYDPARVTLFHTP
jgi:ABC-type Fe3+/spermidine/putrescine transport system ATPase subunit